MGYFIVPGSFKKFTYDNDIYGEKSLHLWLSDGDNEIYRGNMKAIR